MSFLLYSNCIAQKTLRPHGSHLIDNHQLQNWAFGVHEPWVPDGRWAESFSPTATSILCEWRSGPGCLHCLEDLHVWLRARTTKTGKMKWWPVYVEAGGNDWSSRLLLESMYIIKLLASFRWFTFSQRMHTHPYEHMHTNSTLIGTFKDWADKFSRRYWWSHHRRLVINGNIAYHWKHKSVVQPKTSGATKAIVTTRLQDLSH